MPVSKLRFPDAWLTAGILLILFSRLTIAILGTHLEGDDGKRYWRTARNLIHLGIFSGQFRVQPVPTAHDVPVYPLILTAIQLGVSEGSLGQHVAAVASAIAFTASAAIVCAIAQMLFSSLLVTRVTLAIFGLLPEGVAYSSLYIPESFGLLFLCAAAAALLLFCRTRSGGYLLASSFFWTLGFLSKPVLLFFGAIIVVAVLLARGEMAWKKRLGWIACTLALAGALATPWLTRNYRRFGTVTLSSVIGWNLYQLSYRTMMNDSREKLADSDATNPNRLQKYNSRAFVAISAIARRFPLYVWTCVRRFPANYFGTGTPQLLAIFGDKDAAVQLSEWGGQFRERATSPTDVPYSLIALQIVSSFITLLAYALAATGAFVLFRKRSWLEISLCVLPIAIIFLGVGPWCTTRYRIPMMPFIAVLCGLGAESIWRATESLKAVASSRYRSLSEC